MTDTTSDSHCEHCGGKLERADSVVRGAFRLHEYTLCIEHLKERLDELENKLQCHEHSDDED